MGIARMLGRQLMASIFIVSGLEVLARPEPRANAAKPVVDAVAGALPIAPRDPLTAVTLNAMVHVGAGVMLVVGFLPRLAALALATSMVPTTLAGHRFWEIQDPAQRGQQQVQFLKNTAILGGLLVLALD
jgi:putative oxidoreductase